MQGERGYLQKKNYVIWLKNLAICYPFVPFPLFFVLFCFNAFAFYLYMNKGKRSFVFKNKRNYTCKEKSVIHVIAYVTIL